MIVGFVFSLVAAVSLLIIGCSDDAGAFLSGFLFCVTIELAIGTGISLFADIEEDLQPIDVYRGRTTLEITYRDSIAVDSVVVWKEE